MRPEYSMSCKRICIDIYRMKKENKKIRENMISKYDISPIGLRLARSHCTRSRYDNDTKNIVCLLNAC